MDFLVCLNRFLHSIEDRYHGINVSRRPQCAAYDFESIAAKDLMLSAPYLLNQGDRLR